jgi:hypothetical protein
VTLDCDAQITHKRIGSNRRQVGHLTEEQEEEMEVHQGWDRSRVPRNPHTHHLPRLLLRPPSLHQHNSLRQPHPPTHSLPTHLHQGRGSGGPCQCHPPPAPSPPEPALPLSFSQPPPPQTTPPHANKPPPLYPSPLGSAHNPDPTHLHQRRGSRGPCQRHPQLLQASRRLPHLPRSGAAPHRRRCHHPRQAAGGGARRQRRQLLLVVVIGVGGAL